MMARLANPVLSLTSAARRRHALLGALLVALLVVWAGTAAAERRVALLIGNGAYAAFDPLPNPANDASDLAAALEGLGFEVSVGLDLDRNAVINAVSRHIRAAREADVSLFFYAGHGFQVDGRNYLVPVDFELRREVPITDLTIELGEITGRLAGGDGIHLVFLDACRDNPLAGLGLDTGGVLRDGLAQVGDAAGFLFVFATQPDNVALDGLGRNSPFTQALLSHITTPGQDIASTMIAVRRDVIAATGGRQVPWENSSLTRSFRFAEGVAPSLETMLWQVAATAEDPALMSIYLERFPEGAHVRDVETFLGEAAGGAPRSTDQTAVSELALWELARRTRERALIEVYLRQNPSGRHAAEARRLLQSVPRDEDVLASPALLCERLATHPRDATANVAGVAIPALLRHLGAAIEACSEAMAAHPDRPQYAALLARAMHTAGRQGEAVRLYRLAAEQGDLRAMVSLGLLYETGQGVPRDPEAAAALYERAAEGAMPDGMISLALAAIAGRGVERDPARGIALLEEAYAAGSAIAAFNLGVLALEGAAGGPSKAIGYFRHATALGEPRGYVPLAILFDEGRGVERDPEAAAAMLLQGVASDYGRAMEELTLHWRNWSPDTIRAVQIRLQRAGFYDGAIDALSGPRLAAALENWRRGGWLRAQT